MVSFYHWSSKGKPQYNQNERFFPSSLDNQSHGHIFMYNFKLGKIMGQVGQLDTPACIWNLWVNFFPLFNVFSKKKIQIKVKNSEYLQIFFTKIHTLAYAGWSRLAYVKLKAEGRGVRAGLPSAHPLLKKRKILKTPKKISLKEKSKRKFETKML